MADAASLVRTYKFRLLPRKAQHRGLRAALDHSRELYNAALQERISAYSKTGKGLAYLDQCKSITELRKDPAFTQYPVTLQRWPLRKLDLAFGAFFRRLKAGESPGFPRFRSAERYKSFGFSGDIGWKLDGDRLAIKGVGRIRVHRHRPHPSRPVSCQIKQDAKGWVVLFTCKEGVDPLPATGASVGVDVGITSFVALSGGETVPGLKAIRKAETQLRRRQRATSRCVKGSNGRRKAKARVARLYQQVANRRRTFQHQIAARLVRLNDRIVVEDLNISGLSRGFLAKDVNDAGWASFITLLAEKAEKAGRELVKVDCRHTSQTCPECGMIKPKTLAERVHRCGCGLVLDRDVAASRVILSRAVARPGVLNLEAA